MPSITHLLFQRGSIVLAREGCNRGSLCASVDPDLIGGKAQSDEEQNAGSIKHPHVTPRCLSDRERDQICRSIPLSSSPIRPRFFFHCQSVLHAGFTLLSSHTQCGRIAV